MTALTTVLELFGWAVAFLAVLMAAEGFVIAVRRMIEAAADWAATREGERWR